MKEPTKAPAKKSPAKQHSSKKTDSGFEVAHAIQLFNRSADAGKAYLDYMKEKEVTKRAQIEGQKEIILGEKKIEEAQIRHSESMVGLDNADKDSQRRHAEAMTKLALEIRELDGKETLRDRVLALLEAKELTAEEAALLLYGGQE